MDQISNGRGKNQSYPVVFDEWDSLSDAFFSPMSAQNINLNCTDIGQCHSVNDYQLPMFAFGQSSSKFEFII